MKNKLCSLLLIIFLSMQSVIAGLYDNPVNISSFVGKLPQITNIECTFKQEKHLKNIAKPFISGGNFYFEKDKGVTFETIYPVKSTVSYSNKDYKQINDIILAISKKKYSKLEKEFNFYYQQNNNEWQMGLKPKNKSRVEEYIDFITIKGTDYINQININLKNGNNTIIWFMKK